MVNTSEKKANLNETDIVVVLDRSGSMKSIKKETVKGFNSFLKEQKNAEGEAFITLVQFDDRYELNYKSIPVKTAIPLILSKTYQPRGSTALYDAIGKTIVDLQTTRDVVFVIITDGFENASHNFNSSDILKKIESLKNKGWKFVFLAANQDAITVGGTIGVDSGHSMSFGATSKGTKKMFASISSNINSYREHKSMRISKFPDDNFNIDAFGDPLDFSDEQREEQKEEGAI